MRVVKRKGGGELIAAFLAAVFIMALVAYSTYSSVDQEKSRRLIEVMHQYMLIMESNGCLTLSEQQSLILKLEEVGASEIVFHSNPLIKVGYGKEVTLAISGKIDTNSIVGYGKEGFIRQEGGGAFYKVLSSTAQY